MSRFRFVNFHDLVKAERVQQAAVRDCICADPENCTETVPGYRCRKAHGDGVKAAEAAFGVTSGVKMQGEKP